MYYGIEGCTQVSLDCKVNYHDISSYNSMDYLKIALEKEWTLRVSYEGISAEVSASSHGNSDRRVVISILLAGLRQIQESEIYDAAVATIETKLGFKVDTSIPAVVGRITDTEIMYPDKVNYEIYILCGIDSGYFQEPKFLMERIEEMHIMRITLRFGNSKAAIEFDEEIWWDNQSECLQIAKHQLMEQLYKNQYTPSLTALKYYMFEEDMKGPSGKSTSMVMKKGNWSELGYIKDSDIDIPHNHASDMHMYKHPNAEDHRVRELPALYERVKNPVTMQTAILKSVIINLNDVQKWTREQIADWLETLDIDISFKTKEKHDEQD